jgi:F0F1-type ATP synthase assembly protein I
MSKKFTSKSMNFVVGFVSAIAVVSLLLGYVLAIEYLKETRHFLSALLLIAFGVGVFGGFVAWVVEGGLKNHG